MRKRIIKKIGLSVFVISAGLFLWSNSSKADLVGNCIPGGKDWPECKHKEIGDFSFEVNIVDETTK